MKNFYLDIRRCLLHPCFANVMDASILTDYDQYSQVPSCKIESLVEILRHHLVTDGASGVRPSRQILDASSPGASSQVTPVSPMAPQPRPDINRTPDKVIVYSFFASSFSLIKMVSRATQTDVTAPNMRSLQVLEQNDIKVLSIHGGKKQQERVALLEEFKSSGRDGPRVLLISNVGSVGLNIAFANVLIIVVRVKHAFSRICAN